LGGIGIDFTHEVQLHGRDLKITNELINFDSPEVLNYSEVIHFKIPFRPASLI